MAQERVIQESTNNDSFERSPFLVGGRPFAQAIAKERAQDDEYKSRTANGGDRRRNESMHTIGETTEIHERRVADERRK
jgi:hypothetical protein